MYTVKLFTEAEIEVAEACKWYEKQQQGLGKRYLEEVDHYLQLIGANPLQFPIRFSERFRFAVLKKFPYFIVFTIQEDLKLIYVNSVFHTSRNPQYL
jgi:toxin ParE1/3/4